MYGVFHNVQNWLNVRINKKFTCKLESLQLLNGNLLVNMTCFTLSTFHIRQCIIL